MQFAYGFRAGRFGGLAFAFDPLSIVAELRVVDFNHGNPPEIASPKRANNSFSTQPAVNNCKAVISVMARSCGIMSNPLIMAAHHDHRAGRLSAAAPASVVQLRREANKARALGDAAFGEVDRQQLHEIAAALDREATVMEAALVANDRRQPAILKSTVRGASQL
ncbi:MAG: hypothetical protein ABW128_18170 [Rhizorhabdus sp.]